MSLPVSDAIPSFPVHVRLFARPSPTRIAIFLWSVVLAAVLGQAAFASRVPSVFPVYQTAGRLWIQGDDLYDFVRNGHIYRYPPGFAAMFAPLTYLPPRLAELLWRTLGIGVLASGMRLWARHGLQLNADQTAWLFILALPLCLSSLNNGQANTLLTGLALHGATAAVQSRGIRAGGYIALATAVKVYPIAVGLLLACVRPRRLLPGLALSLAALGAFPFLLAPADHVVGQYRRFVESTTADTRREPDHPDPPRDFYLVLRRYVAAPSERAYSLIVLGAAAGMAAVTVVAAKRGRDSKLAMVLAFDLGCIWMTVFGPATEPHTYAILAPTVSAAVLGLRGSWARRSLAIAAYVLLVAPVIRDFFPNGRPFHNLGIQPIGGLLLLGALLWEWAMELGLGRSLPAVSVPSPPLLSGRGAISQR